MDRRAFPAGAGGGLVAASGCLGASTDRPFVTGRSIAVTGRGCGDRRNEGSLDYDEATDELSLDGVVAGTTDCGGLNLEYAGNGASEAAIVEVMPADETDCASCTRYYEYEATTSFRETPSVVEVFHSDPDPLAAIGTTTLQEDDSTTDTAP